VRLLLRTDVDVAGIALKTRNRLTRTGGAAGAMLVGLTALVGHSAFVRYHEYIGLRQVFDLSQTASAGETDALATDTYNHLVQADRWGLVRNPRVERALLTTASRLGRFDEAERYGQRFLAGFPDDHEARVQLAQNYLLHDRSAEAERAVNEVLARTGQPTQQPTPQTRSARIAAHRMRAELLIRRSDFAAAAQDLQAALTLDPHAAALHAGLATVLAELGRFEEAREGLLRAVELDPTLADAYYNLGVIADAFDRGAEAIAFYQRAFALAPDNADLLNNLGFAFLRAGQLDEAQRHLKRAVDLNPQHAGAHYNLGQLYAVSQQTTLAQRHFARATELDRRFAQQPVHIRTDHRTPPATPGPVQGPGQ